MEVTGIITFEMQGTISGIKEYSSRLMNGLADMESPTYRSDERYRSYMSNILVSFDYDRREYKCQTVTMTFYGDAIDADSTRCWFREVFKRVQESSNLRASITFDCSKFMETIAWDKKNQKIVTAKFMKSLDTTLGIEKCEKKESRWVGIIS